MCPCNSTVPTAGAVAPTEQARSAQPLTQTPMGAVTEIEIHYVYKDDGKVQFFPKLNKRYPGEGDGDYSPAWFRMAFQCGAKNSEGSCPQMSVGCYWATVVNKPYDQYIISIFVAESQTPFKIVAFSLPKK